MLCYNGCLLKKCNTKKSEYSIKVPQQNEGCMIYVEKKIEKA